MTCDLEPTPPGGHGVITAPGDRFVAVYHKHEREPQLIAKGAPTGTREFKTRAWGAADDKARELGWIV
ncbi:MAG: hypothetical protein WA441_13070 [Methyloceanibacter sp.]